jgi:hypothetical protein
MATYVERIITSGSTGKKWTFSAWLKLSGVRAGSGAHNQIWNCSSDNDSSHYIEICIKNTSKLDMQFRNGTSGDNGTFIRRITNRSFRDPNAWYHIVLRMDTTQGSADDRFRVYVNGVQETSFDTSTGTIPQNYVTEINTNSAENRIGRGAGSSSAYWDGGMSHIHLCDDQSYAPTSFGETDSTTGEWKIKDDPTGLSYGTNGFFIFKNDSALTDRSGEGHNMSLGAGTLTKTEDCPSNIFCTWDPNYRSARKDMTLTHGNTFIFEQNSGDSGVSGTIAVSSGKYYWEQIIAQVNGTNAAVIGGLHTTEDFNESPTDALSNNTCGMRANGNVYKNGSNLGNFTTADPNGDIFGIGFDADNGSVYFWRNGTALNSGNAIITGLDMTKTWVPFGVQHGGARVTTSTNWGNGYFKTTAVSSAGTNASGVGIFEYNVPAGFTALSTKGLNE